MTASSRAPERHSPPPRTSWCALVLPGVARARVVSWLRAKHARLPNGLRPSVADEHDLLPVYSGGAAPEFHRLPCPAFAMWK